MARPAAPRTPRGGGRARAFERLRAHALSYPEAYEDFPWGESVAKVRGKVFAFFGRPDGELHLSVKLPRSGLFALGLPFASPTAYGLGRSGWVSARFAAGKPVPLELLCQWIDESYRAVAPKKLLAALEAGGVMPRAPRAKRGR